MNRLRPRHSSAYLVPTRRDAMGTNPCTRARRASSANAVVFPDPVGPHSAAAYGRRLHGANISARAVTARLGTIDRPQASSRTEGVVLGTVGRAYPASAPSGSIAPAAATRTVSVP